MACTTFRVAIHILESEADFVLEDDIAAACLPEGIAIGVSRQPSKHTAFLVEFGSLDEAAAVVRKFGEGNQKLQNGCCVSNATLLHEPRKESPAKKPETPHNFTLEEEVAQLRAEVEQLKKLLAGTVEDEEAVPFRRRQVSLPKATSLVANYSRRAFLAVEACFLLSKFPPTVSLLERILAACPYDVQCMVTVDDVLQHIPRYNQSVACLEKVSLSPSELHNLEERLGKHELPLAIILINTRRLEHVSISYQAQKRFVVFDFGDAELGPHFICDDSLTQVVHRIIQKWQPSLQSGEDEDVLDVVVAKVEFSEHLPALDYRYFEMRELSQAVGRLELEVNHLRDGAGLQIMPSAPPLSPMTEVEPTPLAENNEGDHTFFCTLCSKSQNVDEIFTLTSTCKCNMCRQCARNHLSKDVVNASFPLKCPKCRQPIVIEEAELVLTPEEVCAAQISQTVDE